MRTSRWTMLAVAMGLMWVSGARAGSLDPTNAPGPTMHTLEEIYQKVSWISTDVVSVVVQTNVYPVFDSGVPATGQTNSYATGDDGDLRPGVAWPSPRFTVGTGTSTNCVTDNLTGLMWVKNPDATTRNWSTALTYCNGLDGSAGRGGYTDWRLPNAKELYSLIDLGRFTPTLPSGHPFTGVQCRVGTGRLLRSRAGRPTRGPRFSTMAACKTSIRRSRTMCGLSAAGNEDDWALWFFAGFDYLGCRERSPQRSTMSENDNILTKLHDLRLYVVPVLEKLLWDHKK